MKSIDSILEYKFTKDCISLLEDQSKVDVFVKLIKNYIDKEEFSFSSKKARIFALCDIVKNNNSSLENLYVEYLNSKSTYRKLIIRYGESAAISYNSKLKERIPNKITVYTKEYWIKAGYTEEDAIKKVSDIQKNNASKRSESSYKNFSKKCKNSIDYWINLGYTKEEAEILRTPFLKKNDLQSMIERYGEAEGYDKWILRCKKYKESMIENKHTRKSAGYVSKESLKFFVPLYKFCRKLGIPREKIHFGVSGSREYFIRDNSLPHNSGKFYDFTISCINMIIEYNGTFWHAKDKKTWRNPWVDFYDSINDDMYRQKLAESKSMSYYVVWNDDDLKDKFEQLKKIIEVKWNERK